MADNSKNKKICVCFFSMRNPYVKFQDNILFQTITVAKFQCPKFTKRAITQKINYFSPNILFIIPYQLTQVLSFYLLILFQILHLGNFIPCFSKGCNFTRGVIWKKIWICYFAMRNPYMKFLDDTYIRTSQNQYAPHWYKNWENIWEVTKWERAITITPERRQSKYSIQIQIYVTQFTIYTLILNCKIAPRL